MTEHELTALLIVGGGLAIAVFIVPASYLLESVIDLVRKR